MFSLSVRGRKVPHTIVAPVPEAPIRLDEARLAAWRLALGEVRPATDPPRPRRINRGMLPDVDWSNAVPMPRRRTLLRLVAAAIAARMVPLVSLGDSAPHALGTEEGGDAAPQSAADQDNERPLTRLAA